jgi:hypothetical protein
MKVSYGVVLERGSILVLVYRVYSVSNYTIFVLICEVFYALFKVDYLRC